MKFTQLERDTGPVEGLHYTRRILPALIAGGIAIAVNTILLAAADWIPLVTAHGGLLKLLTTYLARPVLSIGLGELWSNLGLPSPANHVFQTGFHVVVGLAMAVLYALAIEPLLTGDAWKKGLIYAFFVWLANAVVVLPWIGEGIAGNRSLEAAGMIYFAAAHTIFFVLMAVLYSNLASRCARTIYPA